jgi:hypothetical protein
MDCVFSFVCACLCRTLHVNVAFEAKLAINDDEAKTAATTVTGKLQTVLEKVTTSISEKKPVDGLEKDANELAAMNPMRVLEAINLIKDMDSTTPALAAALEGDLAKLDKLLLDLGDPCKEVSSWFQELWVSKEEDSDYPDLSVEDSTSIDYPELEIFSHFVNNNRFYVGCVWLSFVCT